MVYPCGKGKDAFERVQILLDGNVWIKDRNIMVTIAVTTSANRCMVTFRGGTLDIITSVPRSFLEI